MAGLEEVETRERLAIAAAVDERRHDATNAAAANATTAADSARRSSRAELTPALKYGMRALRWLGWAGGVRALRAELWCAGCVP